MPDFRGGLIRCESEFLSLTGSEAIFIDGNGDNPEFYLYPTDTPLALIWYMPEEGLYVLEPKKTRTIFLASGQPLGKDRRYVLEPGRKFYIQNEQRLYTLA